MFIHIIFNSLIFDTGSRFFYVFNGVRKRTCTANDSEVYNQ